MGHQIEAFVGKKAAIEDILTPIHYHSPYRYELPQGFELLLCDYYTFDESVEKYLKQLGVELSPEPRDHQIQYAQCVCRQSSVGYIQTDYFGGNGDQSAIFICNGKTGVFLHDWQSTMAFYKNSIYPMELSSLPINTVLASLGVLREAGKDEFDSINLAQYRGMPELR